MLLARHFLVRLVAKRHTQAWKMTTPCARETLSAVFSARTPTLTATGRQDAASCARAHVHARGREGGSLFVFKKMDLCAEEERTDGCVAPLAGEGSVAI